MSQTNVVFIPINGKRPVFKRVYHHFIGFNRNKAIRAVTLSSDSKSTEVLP